jgi:hypothetical protein
MTLSIKARLQYVENSAKLIGFKEQKKYFIFLKPANLA